MVTSELEKVHLSNGGRSRTAAACSGVEFRNGSQLILISKLSKTKLTHRRTFDISGRVIIGNIVRGEMEVKMKSQSVFCFVTSYNLYFCIGR